MKTGILILNFGGPNTLKDVRRFLFNLFSDEEVLLIRNNFFRKALAWIISTLRTPSSKKKYALIGGGSPQNHWSEIQARQLAEHLQSKDIKIALGTRTFSPTIKEGLKELKAWGAERLVLLPLFPHYSFTTTRTCFTEVDRALKEIDWNVEPIRISSYPDQQKYIDLLKGKILETIQFARKMGGTSVHVLFSAHSLPIKIVERGDPYLGDIEKTVAAAVKDLDVPWSLTFQSRTGPVPWLEPSIETSINQLAHQKVDSLVVVPVSFVSDHFETLYELDILYKKFAHSLGIRNYLRCETFNGDPRFTECLSQLVYDHLKTP